MGSNWRDQTCHPSLGQADKGVLPGGWVNTGTVREGENLIENRSKFGSTDNSRNTIQTTGIGFAGDKRE